jgi:hypothetical protein
MRGDFDAMQSMVLFGPNEPKFGAIIIRWFSLDFTVGACMLIRARDVGVFAGIAIEIAIEQQECASMN